MITNKKKYKYSEKISYTTILNQVYIFNEETKKYLFFEDVGALIWNLLPNTELDIINTKLSELYKQPVDLIAQDVSDFIIQLISQGVIKEI